MTGVRRVLIFCALTTVLPITLLVIPLYLRHNLYADVVYAVTESDILEISDGVSTIFCSSHTLKMNGTFNAFQMGHRPEVTSYRKHIRLKKSMTLPDDTLEYWGFYLLRGASVVLSVCSRFPGGSIMVVKGERTLRTCGLLDHNINKAHAKGIYLPKADQQVKITFESNAQVIAFEEPTKTLIKNSSATVPPHSTAKLNGKLAGNLPARPLKLHLQKPTTTKNSEPIDDENPQISTEPTEVNLPNSKQNSDPKNANSTRKLRHAKKQRRERKKNRKINGEKLKNSDETLKSPKNSEKLESLRIRLNSAGSNDGGEEIEDFGESKNANTGKRFKRNQEPLDPPALLDHGIQHGGNALRNSSESSVSSFEEGLFNCYDGHVLLVQEFDPSEFCTNVSYLVNGKHMQMRHDVADDGYYYYIFYSDNDVVFNDMHAVFDIHKPTFQYENVTKSCVNMTECTFPLEMLSNDRVIVEVPTRDGIDHEQDDISLLVSVCHPRMGMYTIFPIAVLFLILSCAFV